MIALQCALKRAAGAVTGNTTLGLLGSAGGAVACAVASAEALELVMVNLLASLVAQTPEKHTSNSEHNGATNTNTHTDDYGLVLGLLRLIVRAAAGRKRNGSLGGDGSD